MTATASPEGAEDMQVLEFVLEGDQYCVDLGHVDEIVNNEDDVTEIPNTDPEVVGVMDLRGRTTTIVDPRIALDLSNDADPKYVIVFESEDEPVGWLIEDVDQVATMDEEHLDESVATDTVNGVFNRGEEFTVWVEPGKIHG